MRKHGVALYVVVITVLMIAQAQIQTKQSFSITIERPAQKAAVAVREDVAGKTSARSRVWLVIQPRETSDCWIQNPAIPTSDGSWRIPAQFGEEGSQHRGKAYEIRALVNPKNPLAPGKVNCWPEADAYSDPVHVTRK